MGYNIFITYKHLDKDVRRLDEDCELDEGTNCTTARDYVDKIQEFLKIVKHWNYAEDGKEDLSRFKDDTIKSKLRDKIFHTSVTIVLISPNMVEFGKPESEQWIPWEIAYSLRCGSKGNDSSKSNAILAVVLPDKNGLYEYFITQRSCGCRTPRSENTFRIIENNMFNRKIKRENYCPECLFNKNHNSYIKIVKWDLFIKNMNKYIDIAKERAENIDKYNIDKQVDPQSV